MDRIMLARVNNQRGVSLDLLQELVASYRPEVLRARMLFGHTRSGADEMPSYGTVESIELEDDILYGNIVLTDSGKELISSGQVVYVSISFTCLIGDPDDDLTYVLDHIDPLAGVDLGDGTIGYGYQVDETGSLINGTGIYLNHVAMLGGSCPAIPGQPTLQEQIKI